MLFTAVFITALLGLGLAQPPPPTCYTGPAGTAGPASNCGQFINTFCDDASLSQTPLRGGDSTSRCFNLPNSNDRCDFIALNTYGPLVPPSNPNCKSVLNNIVTRCPLGGFGQPAPNSYTFTVDPNHGRCSNGVQPGS